MDVFKPVLDRVTEAAKTYEYITIAIDGNSGGGKSTLAELLLKRFDCNIFHMDDFFLTPDMRTPKRLAEIGGNIDYLRFTAQVINQLNKDEFTYEKYGCHEDNFINVPSVCKKRINIIEGVYSLHPLYRHAYNFKVFLAVDQETQKKRILKRSGDIMLGRFLNEWIPLENLYFKETKVLEHCDLIIDTSEA